MIVPENATSSRCLIKWHRGNWDSVQKRHTGANTKILKGNNSKLIFSGLLLFYIIFYCFACAHFTLSEKQSVCYISSMLLSHARRQFLRGRVTRKHENLCSTLQKKCFDTRCHHMRHKIHFLLILPFLQDFLLLFLEHGNMARSTKYAK